MRVIEGDCLEVLKTLPDASIDAVITDPPYPEIDRAYGRWTEGEWWELMMGVCREVRRILKPTGSAVFILQPNSEKVGRMRGWLWRFMAWVCDEWNMVQDAWWWNYTALPLTKNDPTFLRASVKACVWAGPAKCYRGVGEVLWSESDANRASREGGRCSSRLQKRAGGQTVRDDRARTACVKRGGVSPFNLIPAGSDGKDGRHRHPGKTPLALAQWWARYICPPGGTVLDPFAGSGTMGVAALREGRDAVLIERKPEYVEIIHRRLAAERAETPLFGQSEVK